jgi:AhpD family alkylhydroperoxidase
MKRTLLRSQELTCPSCVAKIEIALKVLKGVTDAEHNLLELVKIRTSQINGCAFCIDMHAKDARAAGEIEQRIYALNAWQ